MSINNKIEALSIRNTATKAVNMTEFNNPFLLLSSTKALNELVVNTNPSSRAKVANIEPTKSKYQQNPLGVPIDVYTKDTPTTPQVPKLKGSARLERTRATLKSQLATRVAEQKKQREARQKPKPKVKPSPLPVRPSLKARENKKRAETLAAAAVDRQKKAKAKAKSTIDPINQKPPNKVPFRRGPGRPKSDKKQSEATVVKRPVGRPKSDKKPSEATVVKRPVGRPKNPNPTPDKPKRPVGRPKKSSVVAPKQRAGGGSYESGGLGGF